MQSPVDLAGAWRLSDGSGDYTCDMAVPGDNITALHAAELIPDPYWGRNEYDLRWICDRDWTIRRKFTLTDTGVDLVFDGLDTVCTISVNATKVIATQNAFRQYRVSLADAAVVGQNEITITFHAVTRATEGLAAKQPFPIPYSDNCPIPHGNLIRKPACDFGWDWNIALAPFGILGGIHIEPAKQPRIDRLAISQTHDAGTVTVHVTTHLIDGRGQEVSVTFDGQTDSFTTQTDQPSVSFTVKNPKLWWPCDQGDQPLYDLRVQMADDVTTRKIGLREVELINEDDEAGKSFAFRINGRDVFAKGANWIPADALFGNITPDRTRRLLQSAVDANMNMIRIWGGGRYEADWFYDICDELGLMVWQDFMFACNIYPSDEAFLDEVRAEVHDNVARLHHRACIALWCGDNELVGALDWYDETKQNRDRYLVNYDRLNRAIELQLKNTDPNAIWWPSSPTKGPLDFGDAWHGDGSGDMHFWSVWHEGQDFEHYRDVKPRFCSEFGFQSYPSMGIVERFADPVDWNIAAPVLESHQKNNGGNARIAETMFRYFRWPFTFEDFVWLSQIQQGLAIKTAVDYWRSLRPHCMGTLIWQLNDTWPVCSWASLDHGGGWKLLHYMARDFYAPVTVSAVPQKNGITLTGVNDTPQALDLSVAAFAINLDGRERALTSADTRIQGAATPVLTVAHDALADDELLMFHWTSGQGRGRDLYAPRPFKTYALPDPGLSQTVTKKGGKYILSVTAERLGLFVTAEANQPGHFENNAEHVTPGQPIKLTFVPIDPRHVPKFNLRDLHSATHAAPKDS